MPLIGQFFSCNTTYPAPAEAHTLTTGPHCGVYAFAQTYLEAYNNPGGNNRISSLPASASAASVGLARSVGGDQWLMIPGQPRL
ncbi:hypothetical protein GCM10009744_65230 [Kribbella alba]|uniref:Uncharacterized protein n=1 Tax=Kribbella alba TaxID=190197 RepID=A0ABN2FYY9_9ACTN